MNSLDSPVCVHQWPLFNPNRCPDCVAQDAVEHRSPLDPLGDGSFRGPDESRKGGWVQTYTGHKFWPLDPRPEDVRILDIAHALSMKCRYGGHCKLFYSVAEHSVLIARKLGSLEALMHDAAEAYSPFGDVPRPIRADVPWVHKIEAAIEFAIAARYRLKWPWPKEVKQADNAIICDERPVLMSPMDVDNREWGARGEPLGVDIEGWHPGLAEALFLREFTRLARLDR